MSSKITTGLYWFRHDLRLTDNPTFNKLCSQVEWLICVYVNGQDKELNSKLCEVNTGRFKNAFEQQSADALDISLRHNKQYLLYIDTPAHETIVELVERYTITHIGADYHSGFNENLALQSLQEACPHVEFVIGGGSSMFSVNDLPFELEDLPIFFLSIACGFKF